MRGAIVLGGGRSSRMGTDKLDLTVDGETLLGRTVAAALGWADLVVVASPARPLLAPSDRVVFVLEDPPFGGPVAGIAAGVAALPDHLDEVLVLAGDLAAPADTVSALAGARPGPDGVVLADEEAWPQWLAGRYRASALRGALAEAPATRDVSVRRVLGRLDVAALPAAASVTTDVDTPEQAASAGVEGLYDTP